MRKFVAHFNISCNLIGNHPLTSEIPIGYLTISNALQWRLQYARIRDLKSDIPGIDKIISYNSPK